MILEHGHNVSDFVYLDTGILRVTPPPPSRCAEGEYSGCRPRENTRIGISTGRCSGNQKEPRGVDGTSGISKMRPYEHRRSG